MGREVPDGGAAYVWVADLGLVLAVLLLLVFAFATGSVLDEPQPDTSTVRCPREPQAAALAGGHTSG